MQAYIARRLLLIIPTIVLVTLIVFCLIRFVPGDVVELMVAEMADAGGEIDEEAIRQTLGLDVPIHVQYGRWIWGILQGDFGKSLLSSTRVVDEVRTRFPVSLELGILAILLGQIVAVPVGIYSAVRQDTPSDYISRTLAIAFLCVPNFWLGTLVMVYPAIWWGWSPSVEYIPLVEDPIGNLKMFVIPAIILGLSASGTTMRMTRTMMLEVLRQDYVRTAWSKGLKETVVVLRHALRNALIPVVTIIGFRIPVLIGGTVIMEQIFCLPGMGRLMIEALNSRDYTMLSGVNLFIAVFVLVNNLAIDLSYAYLDPRVRYR
jgi:peptide/nickel transport system permease protein